MRSLMHRILGGKKTAIKVVFCIAVWYVVTIPRLFFIEDHNAQKGFIQKQNNDNIAPIDSKNTTDADSTSTDSINATTYSDKSADTHQIIIADTSSANDETISITDTTMLTSISNMTTSTTSSTTSETTGAIIATTANRTTAITENTNDAKKVPLAQQKNCLNTTRDFRLTQTDEVIKITDIPKLQKLQEQNLCLSYKQQLMFFTMKEKVLSWVIKNNEQNRLLWMIEGDLSFAYHLNQNYAYRHVFKNGGTTVEEMMKVRHTTRDDLGDRKLLATVRDPIDRFLSGWAECAKRHNLENSTMWGGIMSKDNSYDDQVYNWLLGSQNCRKGKAFIRPGGKRAKRNLCSCIGHTYPQANFLMASGHTLEERLDIIGDLKELTKLLELVGVVPHRKTALRGRSASDDRVKKAYFPNDKSLLTNRTVQELCEYLVLDYYLFHFEPPLVCRQKIRQDIHDIVTSYGTKFTSSNTNGNNIAPSDSKNTTDADSTIT